jgi:(E)-4-hydroxy-3-methylbut-2-enyl-diphosphate synthase
MNNIETHPKYRRKNTRKVFVGDIPIGGNAPICVQSMTKTNTADAAATINQIKKLEEAGCEIIRVAVPDTDAALAIREIKKQIKIPLVADIHFDYRLALQAIKSGADKIRINPGNIGNKDRIRQVLQQAKERQLPIRIGVNAGSLEKNLLEKYGHVCARALVESALRHIKICQEFAFDDLVLSLKASDVNLMIESYRLISQKVDFPLHLGVTEAGTYKMATIKSAIGMGTLLHEGIGDTIRVSITGDPISEIETGFRILQALDLRNYGITFISCPTCGRLQTDLLAISRAVEEKVGKLDINLKVAIMGCTVNGPGEARDADIGIACGKKSALLFKKGEIIRKLKENEIVPVLVDEILNWSNGAME